MFNKEKFKEITTKVNYNNKHSSVIMSNCYFKIFNNLVKNGKMKKAHAGYAYSFMYLQTYLFRYTKYENVVLNSSEIKSLLGYNPENRTVNYITKDNGLLDEESITITLYDFPVVHNWKDGHLEFTMLSSLNNNDYYGRKWRDINKVNYNANCKYPCLSFYDGISVAKENGFTLDNYEGSFFNADFTTTVPFEVFAYCMSHDGLGVNGFYAYSYIAYQNGMKGNCQMSINSLAKNCNMSVMTMQKIMNTLRQYNLIHTVVANEFIIGDTNKKGEANTHFHNGFDEFVKDGKLIDLVKPNYRKSATPTKYDETLDTIDFW